MNRFRKGDEVKLKRGGVVMTIEAHGNQQEPHDIADGAKCIRFDHKDIRQGILP